MKKKNGISDSVKNFYVTLSIELGDIAENQNVTLSDKLGDLTRPVTDYITANCFDYRFDCCFDFRLAGRSPCSPAFLMWRFN
jgi:hypothetical protein